MQGTIPIKHGQITPYTTADVADSVGKRYQSENQDTFNDATSSIQTQLNTKLSGYNYKNTTPSATLTGTTSETQLIQVTIPANTFSASDLLKFRCIFVKTGTLGNVTIRAKMTTSPIFPSGISLTQIAIYTMTSTNLYSPFFRENFSIKSGNLSGYSFTIANINDVIANSSPIGSIAFDVTATQYLYISAALANAADSVYLNSIQITNF
jgi:hypothetical protein